MQSGVGGILVDQQELTKYAWCLTVMKGMPSEWINIYQINININGNINQLRLILILILNVWRNEDSEKIRVPDDFFRVFIFS